MAISVKARKAKARWLQNWVALMISDLLKIPAGRHDSSLIEPRQMGQGGVDVILRGEALSRFPYSIECKSGESIGWQNAVRQAKRNKQPGTSWLVFLKTSGFKNPIVMMDAKAFFLLLDSFMNQGGAHED